MASMLDPAAVAKVLGVSEVTLVHWRKKGVGPEWLKRGRYYYYRADRFQDYLEAIGPLPKDLDPWGRRRFFVTAHQPEVTSEEIPETPNRRMTVQELAGRVAELEARLVVVENGKRTRKRKARDVTEAMQAVRRVDRAAAKFTKCGAPKMEGA